MYDARLEQPMSPLPPGSDIILSSKAALACWKDVRKQSQTGNSTPRAAGAAARSHVQLFHSVPLASASSCYGSQSESLFLVGHELGRSRE